MLNRLSERIWVFPFEEERDRPNLCYIRGDRWSLAVDAGHSADHTGAFYRALENAGLPLPELTVLSHWHWDHTFGMHAVNGLCLANELTNRHLAAFRRRIKEEGPGFFFDLHESIRREYEDEKPVIVTLADMTFRGEMILDAGNCTVRVFQAESPHTDDSTLVFVPEEKVLILGDSICGAFPEWTVDRAMAEKLADTIRQTDPEICLPGHWEALPPERIIQDMLEWE